MDLANEQYIELFLVFVTDANIILGVCGITLEEIPLCRDSESVTRAFLSLSIISVLLSVLHIEEERFHSTIMWFT